ncbi:chromosome segregation protein SMC, partial [Lactobacillus salivarius]|nr:chromosome segregation protein SMC [Ligilactobacillus salivarius]
AKEDIKDKQEYIRSTIDSIKKKLKDAQEERKQLHIEVKEAEKQLTRANELQRSAYEEQKKLSIRISQCDTILDRNLKDLSENYGVAFEEVEHQISEKDLNTIEKKLKLLKLGLDELGVVNIGAISEYERVNERYEFLNSQQNDLLSAKEQLEVSMNEMDLEVKNRFQKTFEQVSKAFSEVFPIMFSGGYAKLSLTNPENILETGIEIMAQPPGKKLQQLSLLSGGERALTAITLLFAILKVRPVPFVILDEAEAALDDTNVARYAQYLQKFDNETQFIVITHRKGTMVNADVLYGVTMQESGVSQIVSVALDDID